MLSRIANPVTFASAADVLRVLHAIAACGHRIIAPATARMRVCAVACGAWRRASLSSRAVDLCEAAGAGRRAHHGYSPARPSSILSACIVERLTVSAHWALASQATLASARAARKAARC